MRELLLGYSENTIYSRNNVTFLQNEQFFYTHLKLCLDVIYLFTEINSFTFKTQVASSRSFF